MKKISLFSLVFLMIAAVDSVRNLPASSLFGSQMIFFFAFAAFVFLGPVALVSAELAAKDDLKGGIYQWVLKAFGPKWAMVAIWLQWISTLVWFPTVLAFIGGTVAYLIHPKFAQNPYFLMGVATVIFWLITLVNLRGIHFTVKINTFSAWMGTIIPIMFLIVLGGIWWFTGHPSSIKFSAHTLIPAFNNPDHWVSLVAIVASFTGMELSGVHIKDIDNPQKNFPRAVFFASFFILVTMLFGSLAIAIVVPKNEISLVSGVMQVFDDFFSHFHLHFLVHTLAFVIIIGSIGGLLNWVLAPAKGLMEAAQLGYLPKIFLKRNKAGIEHHVLIVQAIVVTVVCALFLFIPSVNAFYWFLTALSTELYMGMYILMFLAAYKLRHAQETGLKRFVIPGKTFRRMGVIALGLCGCLITIFISFFPPETLNISSGLSYALWILCGNIFTLAPLSLCFLYKKRHGAHLS